MFKSLSGLFTSHPSTVGETYPQHFCSALKFAALMLFGSAVCLVHAVLPFAFTKTGSSTVSRLHQMMIAGRSKHIRTE